MIFHVLVALEHQEEVLKVRMWDIGESQRLVWQNDRVISVFRTGPDGQAV